MKRKIIYIGALANIFEWYDFSVYAYLVSKIGALFFPSGNTQIELIKAFSLFSVSYLIRPLGSIFFGRIADRYNAAVSLKASLLMMAIPTVLIALLPTYAHWGLWAALLLVVLRMIQGFAAGGELPISACYVYEGSPSEKKSFYCSFIGASSMFGVLMGSTVAFLLYWLFSEEQILGWAWRLPFFLGFFILLFIFYLRKNILTLDQKPQKTNKAYEKTWSLALRNKSGLARIIAVNAFISVAFYLLFVWMPSYLHVFLNINQTQAFLSGTIGLFMLIVFTLCFGALAPKIGRRTLALLSIGLIFILTYPLFVVLKEGSVALVFLAQIIFALSLGFIDGINVEMMGSQFNDDFRGRGLAIGFTLPTAIFGGMAPTICSYLIHRTGSDASAIIFLMVMCLVALPAAITLKRDPKLGVAAISLS